MDAQPIRSDSPGKGAAKPAEDTIIRRLDNPYFELRADDGAAYMEGNPFQLVSDDGEAIHPFLAEARLVVDQNTQPRKRAIHYQLDAARHKNIRPLDAIPPSELAAFQEAATDFYDRAAKAGAYEAKLRLGFRFPNPKLEPDAYLV